MKTHRNKKKTFCFMLRIDKTGSVARTVELACKVISFTPQRANECHYIKTRAHCWCGALVKAQLLTPNTLPPVASGGLLTFLSKSQTNKRKSFTTSLFGASKALCKLDYPDWGDLLNKRQTIRFPSTRAKQGLS